MGLAIGLGLDARAGSGAGNGTVAAPPNLALDDLPRDRMIYDSRASAGGNAALVALSGTADDPGATIDLRAWDGTGAAALVEGAAVADSEGRWSAVLEVPRTALWLHPEARADGGPWMRGPARHRFAAGHVIALWQQSEHHHMTLASNDTLARPAIPDPEAVQMVGREWAGIVHCADGAANMTGAMAAWADQWIRTAPGEKVMLIWQTQSGTSYRQLADDDAPSRSWATDRALHDLGTAGGATHVGLAYADWYAAPGSRGDNYVTSLLPLLFEVDAAGAPLDPRGIEYDPGLFYDHSFAELYGGYAATRWLFADPHRFESEADDTERCRIAVRRDWNVAGAAGRILPPGLAPVNYLNGDPGQNGSEDGSGWGDTTHPSNTDADGLQRLARLTALDMARGMGRASFAVPAFDMAEWEPSGAFMEVWSSAGPVTTERLARGEAPIDRGAHPWATEVAGFRINGTLADRAEIAAGRVRVYPLAGGTFAGVEVVTFGENGAAGNPPGDAAGGWPLAKDAMKAGWWMNLPVVDTGAPVIGRLAVLPMPEADTLASTIGGVPMFARAADGGGIFTRFRQDDAATGATSVGAGRTALTARFAVEIDQAIGDSGYTLLEISAGQLLLRTVANTSSNAGACDLIVKDSAGAGIGIVNLPAGTVPFGSRVEFVLGHRFDDAGRPSATWVMVNGTLHEEDAPVPAGTSAGSWQSSRSLRFLPESAPGAFSALELWWSAEQAPGELPAGAPDVLIGPDLASVNDHPWRGGGAATPA